MTRSLPPFWPSVFHRCGVIFFGTLTFFFTLGVVGFSATIFFALLGVLLAPASETSPYEHVSGKEGSRDRILRIDITGPILGSPQNEEDSFFAPLVGVTYGYEVQRQLAEAAKDETIKAVFVNISTPGGTIFGSQAIAEGIRSYRAATQKPLYAFIEGISASGGVWAMVTADRIYADHGSMIGSIGILGPSVFYYDRPTSLDNGLLMGGVTANRIEERTLSAGRSKDIGNPFRRLTPQEIEVFQAGLEQEYSKFINHVAQARGIDPSVIRNKMGAMIFSNEQAQRYRLIDGTRSRPDTLSALASAAKLKEGEYALVRFRRDRSPLINQLFGVQSPPPAPETQQVWKQEQLCALSQLRALAYYGSLSCHRQ
ncbi:S49 family peptidase [Thermosynechococcus sp. PP45]|uniref:S49 family peptidase n=1 Tax=unclassified Thermosynechococcus TaxID=2622553 RepID=UPI002673F695|nr:MULTISPECIES: S49 family peptidase [unclassified Thermosynechococcus]WKT81394.1 S49 family peptidase [Thermosynechococcus sp. PP45]WNC25006.1 S49 family peptidase [Thermosynechococcus sp. PP551]WNC27583.1 S49 family peptidase [Thermosynechococcus sp. PP555]